MEKKGIESLPQFKIHTIIFNDEDFILTGSFNHLSRISSNHGWLYNINSCEDSYNVNQRMLNKDDLKAELVLHKSEYTSILQPENTFPYIDGYWQPRDINIILDESSTWEKVLFVATDAEAFRRDGYIILRQAGQTEKDIPEGAEPIGIKKGGWDHEHCQFCWEEISPFASPYGYKNEDNIWVCESCYNKSVQPHDLSFMLETS